MLALLSNISLFNDEIKSYYFFDVYPHLRAKCGYMHIYLGI